MSKISRRTLVGAFILIFLSSACRLLTGAPPPPGGTIQPGGAITVTASAASSNPPVAPLIPITGENVVSMQCQFCVGQETHAVLVFPHYAYFDTDLSSPVTCMTADVVDNRRIVICRGPQSTSFNLKICSDSSNCLQFPVVLQPCDLLQARPLGPSSPIFLTPLPSQNSEDAENPAPPGSTPFPITDPPLP